MDSNFTFLEMINNAENFNEGDTVTTSGYFNKDDGYGFTYSVSKNKKTFGIKISENYYAVPVFTYDQAKAGIPIECFGVVDAENNELRHPDFNAASNNNGSLLSEFFNAIGSNNIKLLFGLKTYSLKSALYIKDRVIWRGEFLKANNEVTTIELSDEALKKTNNINPYIICFASNTYINNITFNWNTKNCGFTETTVNDITYKSVPCAVKITNSLVDGVSVGRYHTWDKCDVIVTPDLSEAQPTDGSNNEIRAGAVFFDLKAVADYVKLNNCSFTNKTLYGSLNQVGDKEEESSTALLFLKGDIDYVGLSNCVFTRNHRSDMVTIWSNTLPNDTDLCKEKIKHINIQGCTWNVYNDTYDGGGVLAFGNSTVKNIFGKIDVKDCKFNIGKDKDEHNSGDHCKCQEIISCASSNTTVNFVNCQINKFEYDVKISNDSEETVGNYTYLYIPRTDVENVTLTFSGCTFNNVDFNNLNSWQNRDQVLTHKFIFTDNCCFNIRKHLFTQEKKDGEKQVKYCTLYLAVNTVMQNCSLINAMKTEENTKTCIYIKKATDFVNSIDADIKFLKS